MRHRYAFLLLALAALLAPGLAQAQCDIPAFLTITEPGDIAGEYPAGTQSGDGSWADTTGLIPPGITGAIVHVEDPGVDSIAAKPGEGCAPFTNAAAVAGNIAYIRRGACEFGVKALNAQNAGAIGFIIYQDERVADDDETLVIMGGGAQGLNVTIPGIFVSRLTALTILDALKFGTVAGNAQFAACWVGIEPNPDGTPGTHALSSARPNPFSGRTQFALEVAEVQEVSVEVYNTLGQRVAVLHEGPMAPGAERVFTLEAAELPSGVYFYRATGETFTETRSVVLAR